jgi:hypothetical protein
LQFSWITSIFAEKCSTSPGFTQPLQLAGLPYRINWSHVAKLHSF